MFDKHTRKLIDLGLSVPARLLYNAGISANFITVSGFAIGISSCFASALGFYALALAGLLVNRFFDGLDGAVARITQHTDRGGYLDICLDFIFYAAFALSFAASDPENNALPIAVLLCSFMGTAATFLAFAAIAAKRGLETESQGKKSFYYLEGLAEGAETIVAFVLMCLFPSYVPIIAYSFAALCIISTIARLINGAMVLSR